MSDKAGLYMHVPFCKCKCRYCAFYSVVADEKLMEKVAQSMSAQIGALDGQYEFSTIYVGGGSPSVLPCESLKNLLSAAHDKAPKAGEFTVEINPEQATAELFQVLADCWVNRVSIGAQSFNDKELAFLGRSHKVSQTIAAVENAKRAGFKNISIDLIFAIPGQNLENWKQTLSQAVSLPVTHISTYSLTYEENTPLGRELGAGAFKTADEDVDREMYECAIDTLAAKGFGQYEISNFAKPGYECQHNLGCWANMSYAGIGPGASFHLNSVRGTNIEDVNDYARLVNSGQSPVNRQERLEPIEQACETAVLNLRRTKGIDVKEYRARTGYDALEIFAEPISLHKRLKLIECEDGHIRLTRAALPIADSVICDFAAV